MTITVIIDFYARWSSREPEPAGAVTDIRGRNSSSDLVAAPDIVFYIEPSEEEE